MGSKQYDKYCEEEGRKCIDDDYNPYFKTVSVKYPTSLTNYTFMTNYDCKVGDKAVVFTNGNWNVVTITEVHDEPQLKGNFSYTWLVQIVDRTEYDRLVTADHEGHPSVGSRL